MNAKYKKQINDYIDDIVENNIAVDDIVDEKWQKIADIIHTNHYLKNNGTDGLSEFLKYINKKANFLDQELQINHTKFLYITGLIKIFERKRLWRNSFSTWKPKSHNRRKQFSELLFHLFGKYPLPKFLDNVWFRRDTGSYRYRNWYIKLAKGQNLRKQKSRFVITKKIAHYFMSAPQDYTVEQAMMRGVVYSLGGNEKLALALNAANPSLFNENIEFWKKLIQYFIKNPMINKQMIGPIIDYINYQKFDELETYEEGSIIKTAPPQPNFSLSRRNPNSLIKLVENWHSSIRKLNPQDLIIFTTSKIKPYIKTINENKTITIKQLRSNFELFDEGEELSHCVGSFVPSCMRGENSIWSLSIIESDKLKKMLTIEVDSNNLINEVRGKCNRFATTSELIHLTHWAMIEKIEIADWVKDRTT